MNIEGLEKRVTYKGTISYWKGDKLIAKYCTKCGELKEANEFRFSNKTKGTRQSKCKDCFKKYDEGRKERKRELDKKRYEAKREEILKYCREYKAKHKKENQERNRIWLENNKERRKEYLERNRVRFNEIALRNKHRRSKERIQELSKEIQALIPIFKKLELPIYGYIYRFYNTKTKRSYIGQSIRPLRERYRVDIIKGWVNERKKNQNQKFTEELIEEDFELTEMLDAGCCAYHLNKLEAYYINKYDSYNNGYNNMEGKYLSTDGLEEFREILIEHGLEFKDGKLIQIKNTYPNK